jgi:tRNA G10  N-methylase Trm11
MEIQTTMNMESFSNTELEDLYKKRLFLETIKNGRTPKRSGLGLRLYHLAGFTDNIYCTVEPIKKLKRWDLKSHLTKALYYSIFTHDSIRNKIKTNLESDKMLRVFQKYLKDFDTRFYSFRFSVSYDPTKVACWSELDNDLKLMYPKNHIVNDVGFIYYRK